MRFGPSAATRDKKLHGWATIRSVRGVRSIRGRARELIRLQKSIGGVWPLAAESEELAESTMGLVFQRESSGKRKRAGSRLSGG
jgi:hypothetical protein